MTTIVDDNDILRLKTTLFGTGQGHSRPSGQLKKKQLSDTRKDGWKDTLAAKRKERLLWKTRKEEEKEEQRRALDREEAKLRSQQRQQTIARANELIYERNDKVKELRSQQLYTDVIADRERQIMEQQAANVTALKDAEEWHDHTMMLIREAEEEEARRAAERRQKTIRIGDDLHQQRVKAEEKEAMRLQKRQKEEQALIERIQLEERRSEEQAAEEHCRIRLKAKAEMAQIALDAEENRARRLQEEHQDAEIRAKQLKSMVNLTNKRSELEKKHFEERQALTRMLSDRVSTELQERAEKEEQILSAAQQEHQTREIKRQEEKTRAHAEMLLSIDESRREQLLRIQEERREEVRISKNLEAARIQMAEQALEKERAKEEEKRRQNLEIRRIQETQIKEERERRGRGERDRLASERGEIAKLSEEEELFRQFAEREIERFKEAGKNPSLLERTIRNS